jgi:hypothetical protein
MHKSMLPVSYIMTIFLIGTGIFFAACQPEKTPNIGLEESSIKIRPTFPPNTEERPASPSASALPDMKGKPPMPSGGLRQNIPEGSQPFFGTVSNLSEGSFSIKSPMGESKIVFTASTTFEGGSSSNLKNDVRVGGYGTKNNDNTITALKIQINPSMPERGQP